MALKTSDTMIYADYNGSAPLCEDVRQHLLKRLSENGPFANPNAIHQLGQKVLTAMENSRAVCAKSLGAKYGQVIFNSGATEGIATIFHSLLNRKTNPKKNIIITSSIEHSAIINTAMSYQEEYGHQVFFLPTDESGIVSIEELKRLLNEYGRDIALVSIMAANNETGVIQPFKEISRICHNHLVPFFCDTTQIIGKAPFHFEDSEIDYAVMSGHKIGAMTGTGIIMAKDPKTLKPLIIGGGQEKSYRGGTQHYIGLETLAIALGYVEKNYHRIEELNNKRIQFEKNIKKQFPQVVIIGENSPRLATTTYLSLPGIHGQAIQEQLESSGIFVTTSSACSDGETQISKVLQAMGINEEVGRGVVRISLGLCAPLEHYDEIENVLLKAYKKLQ